MARVMYRGDCHGRMEIITLSPSNPTLSIVDKRNNGLNDACDPSVTVLTQRPEEGIGIWGGGRLRPVCNASVLSVGERTKEYRRARR